MDNRRSTLRIADTVRALSPDIVCFQEIHRRLPWSGREDQAAVLERLLGRPFAFQPNFMVGFGGYGIGIAARGHVLERREHALPSVREQRGALELRIAAVGGLKRVTVLCTHWGLNEDERLRQAEALAAIVRSAPRPVIVCGDFNEGPEGAGVKTLMAAAGLQDADLARNCATFVSYKPVSRIDLVLHSADLAPERVEVVHSLASDHLPVCADFSVR
jgi:endonuclease/exonuclease/phosphatase family metal-dependent hydrolase